MASRDRTTVLLVEDKEQVRTVLSEILHQLELDVLEAGDGAHALEVAQDHGGPIHILLTDVVMPGMDGAELATRFRELYPGTKIVFMSGYANESVSDALAAGHAFLRKPFQLDQLKAVLAELQPGSTTS